jgi:prepilin-type N-terminal cleavage/methylation domain-containing protein
MQGYLMRSRNGFTIIELIFVIIIIGVLAATAIPKFKNLKQSAEANNAIKIAQDAFGSLPSSYVNIVDLEEDATPTTVTLGSLINVTGKNWAIGGSATGNGQTITYKEGASNIVLLTLNAADRNVTLSITCANFADTETQAKCTKTLGGATLSQSASF